MKKIQLSFFLVAFVIIAQAAPSIQFTLTVSNPASQTYHIEMLCSGFEGDELDLKMPSWTPGYYQILDYAKYVENFKAVDKQGKDLPWEKKSKNHWRINKSKNQFIKITYDSKATIGFVANSLLDAEHGYIMPAGVFMYVQSHLQLPVTLTINNYSGWTVATGLELKKGTVNVFMTPDFDTFYDCPILLGNLESLPSFTVKNIPHYFYGYKLGEFDKKQFIDDLQKIVRAGVDVIGDIPYSHYTFLAIGPVPGGIEHLNSTGFGFSSKNFDKREGLVRMYNFLSHEYFHHYNVKRIRPIELGPFDYDNGSKTTMLWISEGFNNYYDELNVKRAGVVTKDEYLKEIEARITSFENKPGRLFQTASQASYETWADGPFGRTGDDAYKTISVYEKGSLLGLILDLNIRHFTQNKKSLDDVMRTLYNEYYQQKKRGFTEKEFQEVAERIAEQPLSEFFDYVNTTKEMDYKKYLGYAGLDVIIESKELPEPFVGLNTREKNDTLTIVRVDWESPAWKNNLRTSTVITKINGVRANKELLTQTIKSLKSEDYLTLTVINKGNEREVTLQAVKKTKKIFQLKPVVSPTALQLSISKDWLKD